MVTILLFKDSIDILILIKCILCIEVSFFLLGWGRMKVLLLNLLGKVFQNMNLIWTT